MVGTILSNFWVALIAFTIYFLFLIPLYNAWVLFLHMPVLLAIVCLLLTFLARAIISYIVSNPKELIEEM